MFETGTSRQEARSHSVRHRTVAPLELLNISALSHESQRTSLSDSSKADSKAPTNEVNLSTFAVSLNPKQLVVVLHFHTQTRYELHYCCMFTHLCGGEIPHTPLGGQIKQARANVRVGTRGSAGQTSRKQTASRPKTPRTAV